MKTELSNKELVKAGHQFAKAMGMDTPLIEIAKMIAELASRLDCALAAAAEAGKQRDAVLMNKAIQSVANERQRQHLVEGYTIGSDDSYTSSEMAGAAGCYARHVNGRAWIFASNPDDYQSEPAPGSWPWDESYWKPKSPRKDLVRAAALIIAEIERLDRATDAAKDGEQ
ncbi:hypothetical protein M1D48_12360 [Erwinia sp. D4-22]